MIIKKIVLKLLFYYQAYYKYYKNFFFFKKVEKYINKKILCNFKNYSISEKNIILIDHFEVMNVLIQKMLFFLCLCKHYKAQIYCFNYRYTPQFSLIYKTLGIKILKKKIPIDVKKKIFKTYSKEIEKIKTKKKLLNYKLNGANIGIDIYESYLKRYNKPTVDLKDFKFKLIFFKALKEFFYWKDFLEKNTIKSIHVSHRSYIETNILCKIGYKKKIPTFSITGDFTRISKYFDDKCDENTLFNNLKLIFNSLNLSDQKKGIKKAKIQLNKRLKGINANILYSKKSAFTNIKKYKLYLNNNAKIKVLICTHCFYDNPHAYGKNLFSDFYEWLKFLVSISKKTNYDWYIKPHPDYLPGTLENINKIIYGSKIKLIDPSASFHNLANEKLDYALTAYGSIAHELPLLGINVISCDPNNPHNSYNFTNTPKSFNNYKKKLMNLKKNKRKKIRVEEIYKFYFARYYIIKNEKLFYANYNEFINFYYKDETLFFNYFKKSKILEQIKIIDNFLKSNDKYLVNNKFKKNILKYDNN